MRYGSFKKLIGVIAVATVLWTGLFGALYTMNMRAENPMNCPFMPGHSLCMTSILDHLAHWQAMFVMAVTIVLVLFIVPVWRFVGLLRALQHDVAAVGAALKRYEYDQGIPICDFLQEAFSNGRLHRRVYA